MSKLDKAKLNAAYPCEQNVTKVEADGPVMLLSLSKKYNLPDIIHES